VWKEKYRHIESDTLLFLTPLMVAKSRTGFCDILFASFSVNVFNYSLKFGYMRPWES